MAQLSAPPRHLRPATKRWFAAVCRAYALEEHHRRLLTLAGEAWDRGEQARAALEAGGLTFQDRYGNPRARPEVAVERDSRLAFARLLRELGLTAGPELVVEPEDSAERYLSPFERFRAARQPAPGNDHAAEEQES